MIISPVANQPWSNRQDRIQGLSDPPKENELELKAQSDSREERRNRLESFAQRIQVLKERKLRGDYDSSESRVAFNEVLFRYTKDLYELEQQAEANDKQILKELNDQLDVLNPHIPKFADCVECFGFDSVKENLQETVSYIYSSLSLDDPVSPQTFDRDCCLFNCDPIEMQAIYVQRWIKSFRTNFSLSMIAEIENIWQQMLVQRFKEIGKRRIGNYEVIFALHAQEPLIQEVQNYKAGSFKIVSLVTSFFQTKNLESRGGLVVLQSKPEFRGCGRIQEAYQREVELCRNLTGLPGIWPTYKTIEIEGNTAILQAAAGYRVIDSKSSRAKQVVNLTEMRALFKENHLDREQQQIYLNMIGDFLIGVQSLHNRGIIHRDIKPSNILCRRDGHAALSDLGGACPETLIDENGKSSSNSEKANPNGITFFYASPEMVIQNAAAHEITVQTDIWSVGLNLLELFFECGVESLPPFKDWPKSALSIVPRMLRLLGNPAHYNQYFPEPNDLNSLLHLIWECTRINPKERLKIEELCIKYQSWASEAQQKLEKEEITSLLEALEQELSVYIQGIGIEMISRG